MMFTIIFFVSLLGVGFFINQKADASTIGWMAGRIIDDNVFTAYSSMSASSIQSFLNSKVPSCDTNGTKPASDFGRPDLTHAQYAALRGWQKPPYICLKNYSSGGRSAAKIIYDTAQKYRISPKVLLVLLQKEQSLVTDTWPLNNPQYRSATGYGCPDNAPCDSQYYGLVNQLDWAGKMFRAIMDNSPTWYTPYELGTNYVQYNPSKSCGGSNIYIQNRATQALYNYTPYQPNSATLNAAWGATVTCGAYGNLNFYRYYTKWFGATTSAATYGFSVSSVKRYSDYQYQNEIPVDASIAPNTSFWVEVKLKNTGNQVWYSDNVRLGTSNPRDRSSAFYTTGGTGGWIKATRPANLSEDHVNGGNIGTFRFGMKSPAYLGNYSEAFGVVIEGYRWLSSTVTLPITVASAGAYYIAQPISFEAYLDSAMTTKLNKTKLTTYTGSKIYIKAQVKNRGNRDWPETITKAATTDPRDRSSEYRDASWLSSNRTSLAEEGNVEPQETATFKFILDAPSSPISLRQERFGIVIEGQRWVSDNIGFLSVQTLQRPPAFLSSGQIINKGGALLSGNERYKLVFQSDGNLVLYYFTKAIWASHTTNKQAVKLVMQKDGNLVLYKSNGVAVWSTKTAGGGGSVLRLQSDGNLVIYRSNGQATWATHTN